MISSNYSARTRRQPGQRATGRKRAAIAAVAILGLAGLNACSSPTTSANEVASVDDATSSGTDSTDGTADDSTDTASADATTPNSDDEIDPELLFAEYDKCMQDEGVDMSAFGDSFGFDGGGNAVGDDDSEGQSVTITMPADFDVEAFEAASEVCDPILERLTADMTPEQDAAVADMMVDLENCLKDKGFDIPMTDGGGNALDGTSAVDTLPDDIDLEAFDDALTECQGDIEVPEILTEATAP